MQKVHIVMHVEPYQPSDILAVFTTAEAADKFVSKLPMLTKIYTEVYERDVY